MGDSYCNASKGTDGSEVVCKGVVYGMMKGSRKRSSGKGNEIHVNTEGE